MFRNNLERLDPPPELAERLARFISIKASLDGPQAEADDSDELSGEEPTS